MSIHVCPVATVPVPVEQAWTLIAEPANYAQWWDAETQTITPRGPAQPGQRIQATSTAMGRIWHVSITVDSVDPVLHQIGLETELPFGITVRNHIRCLPLDTTTCRITFG
jgi:hypothetical protein